ncbi:hypothetical protein GOODEAATRI_004029, partial [Goodea atripinnis]
ALGKHCVNRCSYHQCKDALQKLANQYLKREWPESVAEKQADHRNMFCVWRAYLEGTVQATQFRLGSCDNYKVQVADPAKMARLQKEQQLRKCIEQLTVIQAELQDSVKELTKSRKKYQEAETMAQAVREKTEFETKYSQPEGPVPPRWTLDSSEGSKICHVTTKVETKSLPVTLQSPEGQCKDGRIYEQVKDYLVSLCQTELETFQAVHNSFSQLLNSSNGVLQEFHQQMFVQKNPMFQQASDFLYQPVDSDAVNATFLAHLSAFH